MAINLDGLGTVYFEWRRFDEALNYYQQALAEAQEIGKRDEITRDLIHIGGVYQVRGDTARALEYYRRALGMSRQTGARADETTVLNNPGLSPAERKARNSLGLELYSLLLQPRCLAEPQAA